MVQRVATVAFEGIEARAVDVQVQVAPGLPAFKLVGCQSQMCSVVWFSRPAATPTTATLAPGCKRQGRPSRGSAVEAAVGGWTAPRRGTASSLGRVLINAQIAAAICPKNASRAAIDRSTRITKARSDSRSG
jgi:hypothetical protein